MKRSDGFLSKLFGNAYIAAFLWSVATGCVAMFLIYVFNVHFDFDQLTTVSPLLLYLVVGARLILNKQRSRAQRLLLPILSYAAFWVGCCVAYYLLTRVNEDIVPFWDAVRVACGIIPAAYRYSQTNCALILFAPIMLLGIVMSFRARRECKVTNLGCGKHAELAEETSATADSGGVINVKEAVHETS